MRSGRAVNRRWCSTPPRSSRPSPRRAAASGTASARSHSWCSSRRAIAPPGTRGRVEGVRGLADYVAIERLLQSVAGVRRANIAAADANGVAFDVTVRGGAAGLDQGLAGSTRLVRTSAAGAAAVYRYQPQG